MDFNDTQIIATQLLQNYTSKGLTIWDKLTCTDEVSSEDLITKYTVLIKTYKTLTTNINSLLNKQYLSLNSDGDTDYFCSDLYTKSADQYTATDRLILGYLEQLEINPKLLINTVMQYRTFEPIDAFYRIPIYMHLINVLISSIESGRSNIRIVDDLSYHPPFGATFNSETNTDTIYWLDDTKLKVYHHQNTNLYNVEVKRPDGFVLTSIGHNSDDPERLFTLLDFSSVGGKTGVGYDPDDPTKDWSLKIWRQS
jgi:hypothetical protein